MVIGLRKYNHNVFALHDTYVHSISLVLDYIFQVPRHKPLIFMAKAKPILLYANIIIAFGRKHS